MSSVRDGVATLLRRFDATDIHALAELLDVHPESGEAPIFGQPVRKLQLTTRYMSSRPPPTTAVRRALRSAPTPLVWLQILISQNKTNETRVCVCVCAFE